MQAVVRTCDACDAGGDVLLFRWEDGPFPLCEPCQFPVQLCPQCACDILGRPSQVAAAAEDDVDAEADMVDDCDVDADDHADSESPAWHDKMLADKLRSADAAVAGLITSLECRGIYLPGDVSDDVTMTTLTTRLANPMKTMISMRIAGLSLPPLRFRGLRQSRLSPPHLVVSTTTG